MAVKIDVIALGGGLDEASSKAAPIPGRLLAVENFEVAFGAAGYRRIAGYERFDGRTLASEAVHHLLPFDTGTSAIAAGDTATGPSGSGYVLRVDLSSGSWGSGDAAGTLVIGALSGSFADNDAISVSGSPKALVNGTLTEGAAGDEDYSSDSVLAREYARGLITKPTGYNEIRGLAVYQGDVYCLRDADAAGLTATLWRSSASGWTAVRTGLRGGGTLRSDVSNFSGAAGAAKLFGADGKNRCWSYDGSTFAFAPAIYGSEGTSATALTPGNGAKVFTVTEATRDWVAGQSLTIYSAADAGKYMVGTVTTWAEPTLTVNVTSSAGASASDWHIARSDGSNRPTSVIAHKNHLFLAYPLGQLQHSDLGDPFAFGLTSGAIGLGDEIVDLKTLRADVLAALQTNRVSLLYGSSSADWQLKQHSRTSNTRSGSAQEVGGNAIFLTDAGVLTLAGSDAFGDFDAANIAGASLRTLRTVMRDYRCTSLVKSDSQYRVYGANQQVFVLSWAGAVASAETSAITRLRYLHQPVCTASGSLAGEEVSVFGTDDGWVMRERSGTTFDGQTLHAFLRTSYWHARSPDVKKRWRKLKLDCDASQAATIRFRLDYDLGGEETVSSIEFNADAVPSGGFYDVDNWDEFHWSAYDASQIESDVEGVGRCLSLLLWAEGDFQPFSVSNLTMQYSPLELKR